MKFVKLRNSDCNRLTCKEVMLSGVKTFGYFVKQSVSVNVSSFFVVEKNILNCTHPGYML